MMSRLRDSDGSSSNCNVDKVTKVDSQQTVDSILFAEIVYVNEVM